MLQKDVCIISKKWTKKKIKIMKVPEFLLQKKRQVEQTGSLAYLLL